MTTLSDPAIDARFAFVQALVAEAGELANGYFQRLGTLTIKTKGVQDLASEADVETERLIRARIADAFPEDAFLGEETGMSALAPGQGIWVVDPIDGTQPFLSGMSNWCVSIAYLRAGVIEIGAVYAPARSELFLARHGTPSTLNGRALTLHPGAALDQGVVSIGYSTRTGPDAVLPMLERLLRQGGMYHRDGSGALGLCYVGCGRLLGYVESHINSWDCLAAIAVIEGAGGKVNDFLAGDGLTHGNPVIAGTPAVYAALEALLTG